MAVKQQDRQDTLITPSDDNRIRVYLPLMEQEGSTQVDQNVEVIVNGKTYILKRGEDVDVPYCVYEALRNSGRFGRI